MKILIIGTGYVGLVTGVCLADKGHKVTCVDIDERKIKKLKQGISPIHEPGLPELLEKNIGAKKISFETNISPAIKEAEVIFIAVGTPAKENGEADLSYVEQALADIGRNLDHYAVIVNKSTVPVGTAKRAKEIIKKYYGGEFNFVSNPEFLRQGSAVRDFLFPDRLVIGADSEKAQKIMAELYQNFSCPKVFTNLESAEMIKYASNAFLATKISFINEIAGVCEKVGADVKEVAHGMGLDPRIGNKFLEAGLGYGGSCFPKDTRALYQMAGVNGYDFRILKAVIEVNNYQRKSLIEKIEIALGEVKDKTIGIWGLAFKPNTDDIRESAAIEVIQHLIGKGANIKVHDPVAMERAREILDGDIAYHDDPYEVAREAHAVVIITNWQHFKEIDKEKLKILMAEANIIDGRNIYEVEEMKRLGFNYWSIGRT
jgi:UDPglucose 6-dehydrogenase